MEPGQDEVGTSGHRALERGHRLLATGQKAEVVIEFHLLRVEPRRLAHQVEPVLPMAEMDARHAEPLRGQRMVRGALQDCPRGLLHVRVALLPELL